VTTWRIYEEFARVGIKPVGRLTRFEFRRLMAGLSEYEKLDLTIALRQSNLAPLEMAERLDRAAIEDLTGRSLEKTDGGTLELAGSGRARDAGDAVCSASESGAAA
jgi:hypothetical protein